MFVRLDLASQLRKAGFEVIEADNADEAHALLTTKVHVDAMLTDIRMPGTIDGLELAKRNPSVYLKDQNRDRVSLHRSLLGCSGRCDFC